MTITGTITDTIFDDFLKLIELHGCDFLGLYNTAQVKGSIQVDNPKKGSLESLKPYLEQFCIRRQLTLLLE